MARQSKLLDEEVIRVAEEGLKNFGRWGSIATKLTAVIAAKEHGISRVAEIFGITKATLISWIKSVKANGVERLNVQSGRGRKFKLTEEQEQEVGKWIEEDSQVTIDQLQFKIEKEMKVRIGRSTVHRLMQRLNFSYITPRPIHYKQEEGAMVEFKKKSEG